MKKQTMDDVRQLAVQPSAQSEKAQAIVVRARELSEQELVTVAGGLRWGNTGAA